MCSCRRLLACTAFGKKKQADHTREEARSSEGALREEISTVRQRLEAQQASVEAEASSRAAEVQESAERAVGSAEGRLRREVETTAAALRGEFRAGKSDGAPVAQKGGMESLSKILRRAIRPTPLEPIRMCSTRSIRDADVFHPVYPKESGKHLQASPKLT